MMKTCHFSGRTYHLVLMVSTLLLWCVTTIISTLTPFKVYMGTQKSCILNLNDRPSKTIRTSFKKGKELLETQNSCIINLDSPARNTRSASGMLNSPARNTRSASRMLDSPARNTRSALKLTLLKSGNHQTPSKTNKLPVKRKYDFTSFPGQYIFSLFNFFLYLRILLLILFSNYVCYWLSPWKCNWNGGQHGIGSGFIWF